MPETTFLELCKLTEGIDNPGGAYLRKAVEPRTTLCFAPQSHSLLPSSATALRMTATPVLAGARRRRLSSSKCLPAGALGD